VPDLGRWVNRRPTYELSRRSTVSRRPPRPETIQEKETLGMTPIQSEPTPAETEDQEQIGTTPSMQRTWSWQRKPQIERSHSISSVVSDSHYAVLPHGFSLEGWSDEDKEALDDHVRHMLHSKRSKFKQRMVAFGKYIRKREIDPSLVLVANAPLITCSLGVFRNLVCCPHHPLWSGLGAVFDRYVMLTPSSILWANVVQVGFPLVINSLI
jgi:hypothetical protein